MRKGLAVLALLTVLTVIALAGPARGSDGDPLILGKDNVSETPTSVNGGFNIIGGTMIDTVVTHGSYVESPYVFFTCSGTLTVPYGRAIVKTGPSAACAADPGQLSIVATLQFTPGDTDSVQSARALRDGSLRIKLSAPAPSDERVAYFGFRTG
jgi:hypothetical protein